MRIGEKGDELKNIYIWYRFYQPYNLELLFEAFSGIFVPLFAMFDYSKKKVKYSSCFVNNFCAFEVINICIRSELQIQIKGLT